VRIFDQVRARPQYIIDRTVNLYSERSQSQSVGGPENISPAEPAEPLKQRISPLPSDH